MESHVSDTWKAMCQNACKLRQVHVRHMASHVSDTWKAMCKYMQMENNV